MQWFKDFIKRFGGIFSLIFSRKFWAIASAVGYVIFGLDIPDWQKGVLVVIAVFVLVISIAIEDAASKGAGGATIVIEDNSTPASPVE